MILFQFIFDIETGSYNSLEFTMRSSLPHRAPPSFPNQRTMLGDGNCLVCNIWKWGWLGI